MDNKKNDNYVLEEIPLVLPVIPTIDVVVFPHMVVPLLILDEKIIKGVEQAAKDSKKILMLAAQQPSSVNGPISIQDLYNMGTVGNIMRTMKLPEGGVKVLVQGLAKANVEEILSDYENLQARIKPINQEMVTFDETLAEKQVKDLLILIEKMSSDGKIFGPDFQVILSQINDPERIADFILSHLNLTVEQAQQLLEKENLNQHLEEIYKLLEPEVEYNNMQEKINTDTQDSINKSQREYYLREQMKAIQKELGDEGESESGDLKRKISQTPLSEEALSEITKQMRRLDKTAPDSMEATVIRNHMEWILALPWGINTSDNTNIKEAKKILDDNHYGLDEIKDRILDFLSVRTLKNDCDVPILCFTGPPGVGKTSLGKSIAESLGRKYFRISLGGVYDESEIRGHRRTYVGALPGRFIQAVRRAGSSNPLIIIDEIDKIGMANRGDPSAALLEVLDPEQNNTFYDNYLGFHFDMSKCMFITTANDLSAIPGPLRDRMEIINLAGYTIDEKLEIAQKHIVAKAIKKTGLEGKGLVLNKDVIEEIISGYTREAGVRELERQIQKLCSKDARSIVESKQELIFNKEILYKHLGARLNPGDTITKTNKIGVTNGLAWTPFGGEVLQVEAALMPGNGKLILTGQLGDVMKESAQAAVTYAKSHAKTFGIDSKKFTKYDLHIHLPAGAIPKDGPSAGITLLSSLLSVLTDRQINGNYAMTGELNLQGGVLPIGGLKEKILAAKQNGLTNVILPKQNKRDLDGLDKLFQGINIFLVDSVEEVIKHVLMPRAT